MKDICLTLKFGLNEQVRRNIDKFFDDFMFQLTREEFKNLKSQFATSSETATYWELGRRIIEFEQGGKERAGYGEQLLQRLSSYLGKRFGRGFSVDNLESMRLFYLTCMESKISQTVSRKLAEPKRHSVPPQF